MKKNQLENQNLISDNKSIKNDPQKDGNQS